MRAFPLISVTVMFQGLSTQLGTSRLIIQAAAAELPAVSLWVTELPPGTLGYLLSQLSSLELSGPLEESGCPCLTAPGLIIFHRRRVFSVVDCHSRTNDFCRDLQISEILRDVCLFCQSTEIAPALVSLDRSSPLILGDEVQSLLSQPFLTRHLNRKKGL